MTVNSNDRILRRLVNEDGRVRVASAPRVHPSVTGDLLAIGTTVFANVEDISNVVLHVYNAGTASGACGVAILEGSLDSTNGVDGRWFGIQAAVSNANTAVTSVTVGTLAAGAGVATAWEASVNAYRWVRVRQTTAAAANTIARWSIQKGTYATEPLPVTQTTPVTGTVTANEGTPFAPTTTNLNSAASTNATVVKSSAGTLFGINVSNINAAARFLKLYNKATAPTVGTDAPFLTIPVPAGSCQAVGFGSRGIRFATGIGFALTTGAADSDTGAVAANELKVVTSFT